MRGWKRLTYYLLINVLVSACTVVAVLSLWQRFNPYKALPLQVSFLSPVGRGGAPEVSPAVPTSILQTTPEVSLALPSEQPLAAKTPVGDKEYRVQPGDTLGAIAVRFGLTVAEIMEANDLTNPDSLVSGVILIIPGASQEQVSPTDIPSPEAADTLPVPSETPEGEPATEEAPAPTEVAGDARVLIDSVVGAGDLNSERVLLKRSGPGELSLAGWQLLEEGGRSFLFPQLTLYQGGAINVYTRSGQASVVALFWGLEKPVWESGEKVVLLDDTGEEQATFIVP